MKKEKKYSRVDVALEAGLHINTVNAFFRGLSVSEESKYLIETAILKLDKVTASKSPRRILSK